MRIVGEYAWLLSFDDPDERRANGRARAAAALLHGLKPEGMVEAVPAACSLFVQGTPRFDAGILVGLESSPISADMAAGRRHEIAVTRDGEDLPEVCGALGLAAAEFWKAFLGATYVVGFLGFSPGFAYLYGLPRRLKLPRRPTPRVSVPAGSLAMAGPYVGIYPATMPGGWNLLGGVSAAALRPAPDSADPPFTRGRSEVRGMTERLLEIVEAGLLTTVQDLGRPGWGALGIPPSGALDDEALRLANALVGNSAGAAGLEITLRGPTVRAGGDVEIAVVGGDFGPAPGRVLLLADGESVALQATDPPRVAARAVMAVAGGIDVPLLLGSRSTCVVARFGGLHGWPLRRGDEIPVGKPEGGPRAATMLEPLPSSEEVTLRTVPGPQADLFAPPVLETFFGSAFQLLPESNRIGVRLSGPPIRGDAAAIRDLPSEGTPLGAVQITADGQPIILLNERPTTGGYPKIATVIAADLGLLVRARPGAAIRFARVTVEEARRLRTEREERIGRFAAGEGPP